MKDLGPDWNTHIQNRCYNNRTGLPLLRIGNCEHHNEHLSFIYCNKFDYFDILFWTG